VSHKLANSLQFRHKSGGQERFNTSIAEHTATDATMNTSNSHFLDLSSFSTEAQPTSTGASRVRVSVVIPARNAAKTLDATLASVAAQTFQDWEVIVVDDGSIDTTRAVLQARAATDARFRIVTGFGRGVSAARNLGVRHAQGRYIAFLDADDLWTSHKLAAHLSFLQRHRDVGLSFDRVQFLTPDGRETSTVSSAPSGEMEPADMLAENPASTASTLVVRRSVLDDLGGFDEEMRFAEDLEFMVRVRCMSTWRVAGLSRVLTQYRTSLQGASSDLEAMHNGWRTLMNKVRSYAPHLVDAHYAHAEALHLRYLARRAARLRLPTWQGLKFMARALVNSPAILVRQPRRTLGTLAAVLLASVAGPVLAHTA
jgi:glycosyltransferase involved in cell wall biosynthesis